MKFSLKHFLQGFGIIAVILTLLPLVAIDYWWIRIFDFPHAQLTGLTLIALVTYFIRFDIKYYKDYIFVAVLIACFVFQVSKIYAYTPFSAKEALDSTVSTPDKSVKIYSANVLQDNKEYQLLLDQIEQEDPDLILLMETNAQWKQAVHSTISQKYKYHMLKPLDNTYGMLLYSRLPLSETRIRYLVDKEIPSMEAVLKLKSGDKVQLYAIHPTPPMPQHNPKSSDRDTEMMKTAFTVIDRTMPVIVMGDFNDVSWSATTTLFKEVSTLLDPRIGRGMLNTFNAQNILMRWPLDHLFMSEEFRVKKVESTEDINSDHFAMVTELTFEPENSQDQMPEEPTKDQLKRAKDQLKEQNLTTMVDEVQIMSN